VPDDADFVTKTVLAQQMLIRALDAGVPAAWVTAEEAYGKDHKFRTWLETRAYRLRRRGGLQPDHPRRGLISCRCPGGTGTCRCVETPQLR
jgi:hypothetical protein